MSINNPRPQNPFYGSPDPSWNYAMVWEALKVATDQVHEIAPLLGSFKDRNQETDKALLEKLAAVNHSILEIAEYVKPPAAGS